MKIFYVVEVKAENFRSLVVIANGCCCDILLLSSMSLTRSTPSHCTPHNDTTHTHRTLLALQNGFEWSERDKRVSEVAITPTCLRCAQNVATGKKLCKKPEQKRCGHCVKGNRGGCSLVTSPLGFPKHLDFC
jgi:hypothetical protein